LRRPLPVASTPQPGQPVASAHARTTPTVIHVGGLQFSRSASSLPILKTPTS
jgi:hypothetical protein